MHRFHWLAMCYIVGLRECVKQANVVQSQGYLLLEGETVNMPPVVHGFGVAPATIRERGERVMLRMAERGGCGGRGKLPKHQRNRWDLI